MSNSLINCEHFPPSQQFHLKKVSICEIAFKLNSEQLVDSAINDSESLINKFFKIIFSLRNEIHPRVVQWSVNRFLATLCECETN